MPVHLIPCRHKETGALAEIPESALYLFGDFERVDQPDESAPAVEGQGEPSAPEPAEPASDTPGKQASTGRTSKAATSAKKTEEH